jgi:UDP-4-amino-4,6-dideoxy-N-acetyl-beta-L-altrosamine N-acetyltransferase
MFNYESFSLRPIEVKDKDQILRWRNSDRVRSNMYNDYVISQEEHDAWFSRALVDKGSVYLVFLHDARPIGFASFTNISAVHERCYWAFYLGETDVPRGCGSVMEFFALDYAFHNLKIRKLCCEVFTFNEGVIKLHEKFGFTQEGRFVGHYKKNERYEDIVCLAKFATSWVDERPAFEKRLFGE